MPGKRAQFLCANQLSIIIVENNQINNRKSPRTLSLINLREQK